MKSKSLFLLLAFLLLLTIGCTTKDEILLKHSQKNSQLIKKKLHENAAATFQIPIKVNPYSFVEISDWYDNNSILVLRDENAISYIDTVHLKTGEKNEFFHIDEPILSVEANDDYSYFAVQTSTYDMNSPLYFLDKAGKIVFKLSEMGEEYSLFWNPYQTDELIIIAFLPDWEYDVYRLYLKDQKLVPLDLETTYFQWLTEDEVAFLEWSSLGPSFFAPIYKYNFNTKETEKLLDEVIAFFTFDEKVLVAVSAEALSAESSVYQFYRNQQVVNEVAIPALNTYSEQWWIPFHQYDSKEHSFYYLKPLYSGDFFNYDDPFELTKFDVKTGTEQKIVDVDLQAPLKMSPDGKWMLYGNQYEWLIDLTNKTIHSLLE